MKINLYSWTVPSILLLIVIGCSSQLQSELKNGDSEQKESGSVQEDSTDDQNYPEVQLLPDQFALKGTLLDESGNPASGVEVRLMASREPLKTKTAPNGRFSFPVDYYTHLWAFLFASDKNGQVSVLHEFQQASPSTKTTGPVILQLKPSKKARVHVVDSEGNNLDGVNVKTFHSRDVLFSGKTNSHGLLELLYPQRAKILNVIAYKPGTGFDYFNNFIKEPGHVSYSINPALPETLKFILDGAKTLHILALDINGNPVPDETFIIKGILKNEEGKNIHSTKLNQNDRELWAITNEKGVAEFPWFPMNFESARIELSSRNYSVKYEYQITNHDQITAKLFQRINLAINVTFPDGKPAPKIGIQIKGDDGDRHSLLDFLETNQDGFCKKILDTKYAYLVRVMDEEWTAPFQEFYLKEGSSDKVLNMTLSKGTAIYGTVTVGQDKTAAVDRSVSVEMIFDEKQSKKKGDEPALSFYETIQTDQKGQYRFNLPPGKYRIEGPSESGTQDVVLTSDSDVVQDFYISRQDKGILKGQVVLKEKDRQGKTVPLFNIHGVADFMLGFDHFKVTTDESGHFETERWLADMVIFARSKDRSLGGIAIISPDDSEVKISIAPTITVTGTAYDLSGKPLARNLIHYAIPKLLNTTNSGGNWYSTAVKTDNEGRFELKEIIPGQTYELSDDKKRIYKFSVKDSKSIDLGKIYLK